MLWCVLTLMQSPPFSAAVSRLPCHDNPLCLRRHLLLLLLLLPSSVSLSSPHMCLTLNITTGVIVPDAWTTWFIGCLPQAILGMVITPLLLFKLFPPEVRVCRVCEFVCLGV